MATAIGVTLTCLLAGFQFVQTYGVTWVDITFPDATWRVSDVEYEFVWQSHEQPLIIAILDVEGRHLNQADDRMIKATLTLQSLNNTPSGWANQRPTGASEVASCAIQTQNSSPDRETIESGLHVIDPTLSEDLRTGLATVLSRQLREAFEHMSVGSTEFMTDLSMMRPLPWTIRAAAGSAAHDVSYSEIIGAYLLFHSPIIFGIGIGIVLARTIGRRVPGHVRAASVADWARQSNDVCL